MEASCRDQLRIENIRWLDAQWGGPGWLPPDVRATQPNTGPTQKAGKWMRRITELAIANDVSLPSLWDADGYLRIGLERDLAARTHQQIKRPPVLFLSERIMRDAYELMIKSLQNRLGDSFCWFSSSDPRVGRRSIHSTAFMPPIQNNADLSTKQDIVEEEEENEEDDQDSLYQPSSPDTPENSLSPCSPDDPAAITNHQTPDTPPPVKRALSDIQDTLSSFSSKKICRDDVERKLEGLDCDDIDIVRTEVVAEITAARAAKEDADEYLMKLLHPNESTIEEWVSQAEKVEARRQTQEAEENLREAQQNYRRSCGVLDAISNMKKTYDRRTKATAKLEKAEKTMERAKRRAENAQKFCDEAWDLNLPDAADCDTLLDALKKMDDEEEVLE